jgi:hypothetical protein
MQNTIFNYPNLDVHLGSVFDIIFSHPNPTSPSSGSPQWGTIEGVKLGKPLKHGIRLISDNQLQIRVKSSNALK